MREITAEQGGQLIHPVFRGDQFTMETQKMSANLLSVYQKYKVTHEVKALLSTRKKESSSALVFMHKGVYGC